MADNEPIAKRLTALQAKLTERAQAIKDPKNGDRAVMLESLALIAEAVAKLSRDMRGLKTAKGGAKAEGKPAKGRKAGAGKPGAGKAAGAKTVDGGSD